MAFKWTDNLTDRLVDLYQEREYLYDTTSDQYHNKDVREMGLKEISFQLSLTGKFT